MRKKFYKNKDELKKKIRHLRENDEYLEDEDEEFDIDDGLKEIVNDIEVECIEPLEELYKELKKVGEDVEWIVEDISHDDFVITGVFINDEVRVDDIYTTRFIKGKVKEMIEYIKVSMDNLGYDFEQDEDYMQQYLDALEEEGFVWRIDIKIKTDEKGVVNYIEINTVDNVPGSLIASRNEGYIVFVRNE